MRFKDSTATLLIGICAAALCAGALALKAQQPAPGGRGGRGGAAAGIFTAVDVNKDGFVTRDELKAAFAKWLSDADAGGPARTAGSACRRLDCRHCPSPTPAAAAAGRAAARRPRPPNRPTWRR